jgi:hypothetical protein
MTAPDFTSPREGPRAFTPRPRALTLSLYAIWEDAGLSKRDRSLITVAALAAMGQTGARSPLLLSPERRHEKPNHGSAAARSTSHHLVYSFKL